MYARLWRYLYRPQADTSPAPPLRQLSGAWSMCPGYQPQLLGPRTFRFLNQTRELTSAADWNSLSPDNLWLYNLHYFGDLVAEGFNERVTWHRQLLERWMAENPPATGIGWESYPLSRRIVNWIKWALAGGELSPALVHSLAVQARYLSRRLEYHLQGNHLFSNAKALIFAGAFFSGQEAARWLHVGLKLLNSQMREQFLADGGHFERSPMYHSMLTEDLLDLVQLRSLYPAVLEARNSQALRSIDPRPMLRWLQVMTHPDGGIAFFNDAAFGVAPSCATLFAYARNLGLAVTERPTETIESLPDSGYVRLENGSAVLIVDVGAIGPDYLPAHAHADTLSFELSLKGRRVLVNSGTSTYSGPLRHRQRATAAHNSLTVDEMDSSKVWSNFRVAHRARPIDVRVERGCASAAHDGYRRLPGNPIHRRRCELQSGQLQIEDLVEGSSQHSVALHFHAAPGLEISRDGDTWLLSENSSPVANLRCPEGMQSDVVDTVYYPEFGVAARNKTLIARWRGSLPFRGTTVISCCGDT